MEHPNTPGAAVAAARREAEEAGIPPEKYDSGLSVVEAEALLAHLATVRGRLRTVEEAAEHLLEVFSGTGNDRKIAIDQLVAALTTDFRTQVICSDDMTDQQRAEWLAAGEGEK